MEITVTGQEGGSSSSSSSSENASSSGESTIAFLAGQVSIRDDPFYCRTFQSLLAGLYVFIPEHSLHG